MIVRKPSIGIFLARPDRSYHMARELRRRGFDVVHYNTVGYENDVYVKLHGGPIVALAHLLLRTHHDIYFTSLGFIPSFWLYLNRRLRGKRYVFNATGVRWETFADRSSKKMFSGFFAHKFYPYLLDCSFGGASKIVCNSHFLESTFRNRFPQFQPRLITIYNGIDADLYSSGRPQAIPGVNKGDPVLLCVTALNFKNKSKALELVINAFGHVLAERKNVKLVIAAKSTNPVYQDAASAYLQTKPWRSSVKLFFNQKNVPDLLASSDLFVYATLDNSNDSLPRALLEAQAAGLPVVTTKTSGCPEIVVDGRTGLLASYDAREMAEKILHLIDNPGTRAEMGRHAREWIRQRFNWADMACAYEQVFLELADGVPRGGRHEV